MGNRYSRFNSNGALKYKYPIVGLINNKRNHQMHLLILHGYQCCRTCCQTWPGVRGFPASTSALHCSDSDSDLSPVCLRPRPGWGHKVLTYAVESFSISALWTNFLQSDDSQSDDSPIDDWLQVRKIYFKYTSSPGTKFK